MIVVICLAFIPFTVSQVVCTTYTCAELPADVCASFKDYVFTVNENGCSSGKVCPFVQSRTYFRENGDGTYPCVDKDSFIDYIEDIEAYEAEIDGKWSETVECVYDPELDLASGSYPKECDDDSDCLLKNGEYGRCACGMAQKAYCYPLGASSFIKEWYELCESGEANLAYYKYYAFKVQLYLYVLTIDDVENGSCLKDVFYEEAMLEEVKQGYEDQLDDEAFKLVFTSVMGLLLLA